MQQPISIQVIDSTLLEARPRLHANRKLLVRRRDRGAMLLAVLFLMAMMVIAAMAIAPAFVQQMKRDREEEMIHRGTEYARAIKNYYKKFGRYPANLEQLENTNNIRFLRKRFKDPLNKKEGQWKLLRYGDIQALVGAGGFGLPGAQTGVQGGLQGLNSQSPAAAGATSATSNDQGASTAPVGAQLSPQQQGAFLNGPQLGAAQPTAGVTQPGIGGGAASGQSGFSLGQSNGQPGSTSAGASQTGNTTGQTGSNNTIFGNSGVGGQSFGGGAIVGVASTSKDPTIRVFNKKKKYDEWVFIYSPMLDQQNTLLRGPYNGQTMSAGQFGTPAGQLNQNNQSGFGQQPGGLGQQQPGGFGQQTPQQNQQSPPGTQFPPDQVQPQQ